MNFSRILQKFFTLILSIMLSMTAVDVSAINFDRIDFSKFNILRKENSSISLSTTQTANVTLEQNTPKITSTPSPTKTAIITPEISESPSLTDVVVSTPTPSATPTPTSTPTPTPVPTPTPTPKPTPTPTANPYKIYYPYSDPIHRVQSSDKKLCLTINVAWGGDDIPQILDMLDKYDLKITFFLVGKWAEQNPDKARMIRDRGHEIGGHSYNHVVPSYGASWNSVANDMQKCVSSLEKVLGFRPTLYRFPSGGYTARSLAFCAELGMIPVQWSADSVDWDTTQTETKALTRIKSELSGHGTNGGIVLFHSGRPLVQTLLPTLIEEYTQKGYSCVTVSELLYADNYVVDFGVMKPR